MFRGAILGYMKRKQEPPRITIEVDDLSLRDAFVEKVRSKGKTVKYVITQWMKSYLRD